VAATPDVKHDFDREPMPDANASLDELSTGQLTAEYVILVWSASEPSRNQAQRLIGANELF